MSDALTPGGRRYRDRIAAGRCGRCGAVPTPGKTLCASCQAYNRACGLAYRAAARRRREAFRRALVWRQDGRLMGGPTG